MQTQAQKFGADVRSKGLGAAIGDHFHLINPNGCTTAFGEHTFLFEDGSRFRWFWHAGFTTDRGA